MLPIIYMLWSIECFDFSVLLFKAFCFIVIYWSVFKLLVSQCVCVCVCRVGACMRACVRACVCVCVCVHCYCLATVFSLYLSGFYLRVSLPELLMFYSVLTVLPMFSLLSDVNDEPESQFLYTETIKLYCTDHCKLRSVLRRRRLSWNQDQWRPSDSTGFRLIFDFSVSFSLSFSFSFSFSFSCFFFPFWVLQSSFTG